jgi:hypothetical protein
LGTSWFWGFERYMPKHQCLPVEGKIQNTDLNLWYCKVFKMGTKEMCFFRVDRYGHDVATQCD